MAKKTVEPVEGTVQVNIAGTVLHSPDPIAVADLEQTSREQEIPLVLHFPRSTRSSVWRRRSLLQQAHGHSWQTMFLLFPHIETSTSCHCRNHVGFHPTLLCHCPSKPSHHKCGNFACLSKLVYILSPYHTYSSCRAQGTGSCC